MPARFATVACFAALFSVSCGDDDRSGGSSAPRQRALVEKSCAHTLLCRPEAYAEDFADSDACIAAYGEELAGEKAEVRAACFEALLDYVECTIEDCETEDVDCQELNAKLRTACDESAATEGASDRLLGVRVSKLSEKWAAREKKSRGRVDPGPPRSSP